MMLNLIQICTRALDDISSFNIPTFIVGNSTDDTARTLLSAAFKVGEELARDYDWEEFSKTATVNTVVDQAEYAVEDDYERIASDTMWNSTQNRRMWGPKTRRQWAELTNFITSNGIEHRWRLKGRKIQIDPTPSSVFTFDYEYLSRSYATDLNGADRTDGWAADSDLPKIPADLFILGIRYYFADTKNLPRASMAGAEYDAVIKSRQNKNKPSQAISYASSIVPPRNRNKRYLNIPDTIPTS